jgi:hypothetical protein
MHRFRSHSIIARFRIVSLLIFLKLLMIPTSLGMIFYALFENDKPLLVKGTAASGLTICVAVTQWLLAARTRCPLCLTPVLAQKACAKNRNARKLFGSYRIRVAVGVLFKGSFRCPYCNEPTAMEVRDRH